MVHVRYGRAVAVAPRTQVIRGDGMRRTNLGALLREVHQGACTRSALVERTGLTRAAIGALLGVLGDAGLVTEGGGDEPAAGPRRPGRPSHVVSGDPRAAVLACEVTADALSLAVIGLGGRVVARSSVDHVVTHSPDDDDRPLADPGEAMAATTPSMLRVFSAATQMRPESTP